MSFMTIKELVALREDELVQNVFELGMIHGVNPRMGGDGEANRVAWLKKYFDAHNIPYQEYNIEDNAVPEGKRTTLIVKIEGSEDKEKTLWFMAHTDTVAPGDLNDWNTDPFQPTRIGDRIYGLGVEDNGQAVVCLMQTCLMMKEMGLTPKCNVAFLFAADEETGSQYGLHALFDIPGLFSERDEAVVPDAGSHDGTFIEVAEKSQVWLVFTVQGKQAHGSMPHLGINAGYVGAKMAVEIIDTLRTQFAYKDDLFDPPYSTFEYTQKFANVESPNVLPGRDVFAMDLRILPQFTVEEVLSCINRIISRYEYAYKVRISYEITQRADAAPVTSPDSKVASTLQQILKSAGVNAFCGGIGGGTCGAILRKHGIPTVVWSTLDELAHQPNEYTIVPNLVQDTAVFLSIISEYC